MDFRNLHFLKSLNPIEFLEKPSKESVDFVQKILNTPDFIDFLTNIRAKYNFPDEGMDLTQFTGKNFDEIPLENTEILKTTLYFLADTLRKRLNLATDFTQQIFLLLFFNSIIDVKYYEGFITDKIEFVVTKKQITSKLFDFKYEVGAILVPFNMSFNMFIKQVKPLWKDMQDEMNKNLTVNPYEIKVRKNTELAVEIIRLKDKENMTFPEIADKLYSASDGTNEKLGKEEYIKKLYYEYKLIWEYPLNQQKPQ